MCKKSTLSFDQNVPLNCQSEIGRRQWRSSKYSQVVGTLNRSIYFSLAVVTNVNRNSITRISINDVTLNVVPSVTYDTELIGYE